MVCMYCNGFYGASHSQPVCATCHAFLYEYLVEEDEVALVGGRNNTFASAFTKGEGDASDDSGTEEPSEERPPPPVPPVEAGEPAAGIQPVDGQQNEAVPLPAVAAAVDEPMEMAQAQAAALPVRARVTALSLAAQQDRIGGMYLNCCYGDRGYYDSLPPMELFATEVLLAIFRHCDDLSLWTLRLVCSRFRDILDREVSEEEWREFVTRRWPLFRSHCRIHNWRQLYSNLLLSSTCRHCLEQLQTPVMFRAEATSWRLHRLRTEQRSLAGDPPYGILILPLDHRSFSRWMAAVAGPSGSPYEGGLFYLSVTVPMSYPLRPPVVRFLTRIFHPNVSRHGDIGLDCITSNWSLALTLAKVLVCVQSLLTDPYTQVCMEPHVGCMYREQRTLFDSTAQQWTWRYAMHDYIPTKLHCLVYNEEVDEVVDIEELPFEEAAA